MVVEMGLEEAGRLAGFYLPGYIRVPGLELGLWVCRWKEVHGSRGM